MARLASSYFYFKSWLRIFDRLQGNLKYWMLVSGGQILKTTLQLGAEEIAVPTFPRKIRQRCINTWRKEVG